MNPNDNAKDNDNPDGGSVSATQLAWLDADLAAARANDANWLIVAYHKPLFSSSYHSLQDKDVQALREELMAVLDTYDVDVVLNGHDHVLTVTKPLAYDGDAFAAGAVTDAETFNQDGETYVKTDGTVFVIPNTAGTKNYDDLYNGTLEHLAEVRPALADLTQEEVDYYNSLFEVSDQPGDSEGFETTHENYREGNIQNYAVYDVTATTLSVKLYQVEGELTAEGEDPLRDAELVYEINLVNDDFLLEEDEYVDSNN